MKPLSDCEKRVIKRALSRPGFLVCPTPGLWAAAQTGVLKSLERRGLVDNSIVPALTDKGIEVANKLTEKTKGDAT